MKQADQTLDGFKDKMTNGNAMKTKDDTVKNDSVIMVILFLLFICFY